MNRYVRPSLLLQILEQVDDLRLNRHVERGDRLVANDEFRIHRESARDADALALAAGKFVRIPVGVIRLKADEAQEFLNPPLGGFAGREVMNFERFADDVGNGHAGIERCKRILEDDLHFFAQPAQFRARTVQNVAPVEPNLAFGRRQQAQDDAADRRFAGAGLPDQAESFTRRDRKVHAVDGFDVGDVPRNEPRADRKIFVEIFDLEQSAPAVAVRRVVHECATVSTSIGR